MVETNEYILVSGLKYTSPSRQDIGIKDIIGENIPFILCAPLKISGVTHQNICIFAWRLKTFVFGANKKTYSTEKSVVPNDFEKSTGLSPKNNTANRPMVSLEFPDCKNEEN